MTHFLYSLNTF